MEEKRGGTAFTLSRRIGSTTLKVNVYCIDTATKTFEDKIKRMIRNESVESWQLRRTPVPASLWVHEGPR